MSQSPTPPNSNKEMVQLSVTNFNIQPDSIAWLAANLSGDQDFAIQIWESNNTTQASVFRWNGDSMTLVSISPVDLDLDVGALIH